MSSLPSAFLLPDFLPHGYCYLWNRPLLWTHLSTDMLIGLSYVAISCTLAYLVYRLRREIPYSAMLLAFGTFIIACGATHFMEVITLWHPVYWTSAGVKVATALASIITAIALPRLVPGVITTVRQSQRAAALEAQIRHAQKMDAVGRLAGGIARDITSLASVVQTHCGLLALDLAVGQGKMDDVQHIKRAADHATELMQRLLTFSSTHTATLAPVDINRLIGDTIPTIQDVVGSGVTIIQKLDPALPLVMADAARFRQALLNLAANARDAMPRGGMFILRTRRHAGSCTVTVADTGSGMDAETQAHLFEPFFTTRPHGQGAGLGLAMVYAAVQQLGGSIAVESELGRGTTLTMTLPMAATASDIRETFVMAPLPA